MDGDAVVSIGGRMGTFHEFTIAMETRTPIGFLQGAGGISDEIMEILHATGENRSELVVFDDDPDKLIAKLIKILNKLNHSHRAIYNQE